MKTLSQTPRALAAFLLGLLTMLWWQHWRDQTVLRQMDDDPSPTP